MMDILLINPRTSTATTVESWQKEAIYKGGVLHKVNADIREPPNGILILAAMLDAMGYSVNIIDCSILHAPKRYISERISEYRLVGLTSLTNTIDITLEYADLIKQINPEAYIIMGGPHVSFRYNETLQESPNIDAICVGESENSFPWLVENLLGDPILEAVYSSKHNCLPFKKNAVNDLHQTMKDFPKGIAFEDVFTGFPDATDLENLPHPARHLLPQNYSVANILVNRGCPFRCSFCSRSNLFPETRIRPINHVLTELKMLKVHFTYNTVNFYDNININREYFHQFLHGLIDMKWNIPWGAELRVDLITDEEAQLLVQANCSMIASGVESADDEVLKINHKAQNLKKEREGIIRLKKYGVGVQLFFIVGLPGETHESFQKSLDFVRSLPLDPEQDRVEFFNLMPYPGCDIAENPEKYHIKIINEKKEEYDCHNLVLETDTLREEEIREMMEDANNLLKELGFSEEELEK